MSFKGNIWKYGDDINTDVIFPGRYLYTLADPEEIARHALEDLDSNFAKEVKNGDIIVAGKNFGCGSSREQAATCLKYNGIKAVIAKSFARIFFRNAINHGLPLIQSEKAVEEILIGDIVTIDFEESKILTNKKSISFYPLHGSALIILESGGLIPYVRKYLKSRKIGVKK